MQGRGTGLSRRQVLAGLLSGAALPAHALAPSQSLRPEPRPGLRPGMSLPSIGALFEAAGLPGAQLACVVADARTGQVLETHNPLLELPPASVAKALTAAYAMAHLGSGFRFQTRLYATGPVQGGRIDGDLILAGGGDPTLDTDGLARLAAQLKEAGVREVRGGFRVWGGALPFVPEIDKSQPEHLGYNPSVSGMNLNYNRVFFEWKAAGAGRWTVTVDARSDRYRPRVDGVRVSISDSQSSTYVYRSRNGMDQWTVREQDLGNGGGRWLPTRTPVAYAGEVFRTLARSHGIVLPEAAETSRAPTGTVIAAQTSAPLNEVIRGMLRWSTNLTAESVGLMASAAATGKRPASLRSSALSMSRWIGALTQRPNPKLMDHSGLGDTSRISPTDMVKALVRIGGDTGLPGLLRSIPMRDETGAPIENHPAKVFAKTGTLNFVSSLAGYVRAPGGRELAFAIFVADTNRRAAIPKEKRERPEGSRPWARRARRLQSALLERWADVYDA